MENVETTQSTFMDGELFKPINKEGFSHYRVTSKGRVYNRENSLSIYNLAFLKPMLKKGGCNVVISLFNHGNDLTNYPVWKLVAEHFTDFGNDDKTHVIHIDGDIRNNSVENLHFVTEGNCRFYKRYHGMLKGEKRTGICKRKKNHDHFEVTIHKDNKKYHAGTFFTMENAIIGHDKKMKELYDIEFGFMTKNGDV